MILTTQDKEKSLIQFVHPMSLKLFKCIFHEGLIYIPLLVSNRAKEPEEFHLFDLCFTKQTGI